MVEEKNETAGIEETIREGSLDSVSTSTRFADVSGFLLTPLSNRISFSLSKSVAGC